MDTTHDGIHRQGHTIKIHTPCNIHREFYTINQYQVFKRLHRKNCAECQKCKGMTFITQQYTTIEDKLHNKKDKAKNIEKCQKKLEKNKYLQTQQKIYEEEAKNLNNVAFQTTPSG